MSQPPIPPCVACQGRSLPRCDQSSIWCLNHSTGSLPNPCEWCRGQRRICCHPFDNKCLRRDGPVSQTPAAPGPLAQSTQTVTAGPSTGPGRGGGGDMPPPPVPARGQVAPPAFDPNALVGVEGDGVPQGVVCYNCYAWQDRSVCNTQDPACGRHGSADPWIRVPPPPRPTAAQYWAQVEYQTRKQDQIQAQGGNQFPTPGGNQFPAPGGNQQAAQRGNQYASQNVYGVPPPPQGTIPIEEVLYSNRVRREQRNATDDPQKQTRIFNAAIDQTLYNQQIRAGAQPGQARGNHGSANRDGDRRESTSVSAHPTALPPSVMDNREQHRTAANTQARTNASGATSDQVSSTQQSSSRNHSSNGSGNNNSNSRGVSTANTTLHHDTGTQQNSAGNQSGGSSGNDSSSSRGGGRGRPRGRGRGGGRGGGEAGRG